MDLVNPEATVTADEQVLTSGYQGGLYPPGLLIDGIELRDRVWLDRTVLSGQVGGVV